MDKANGGASSALEMLNLRGSWDNRVEMLAK